MSSATFETVIGLEVHVQLKTATKAFCGCRNEFGHEPNTSVCPVCLGFPGSLPVLNQKALDMALKTALAFDCQIAPLTKFDRKNYYYPDLPKNFQISQYDIPFSSNGWLNIESSVPGRTIRIKRIHLEEDAGKLIHEDTATLVDFNRSGTPLLEIVSQPDIRSPQEAYDYLTALKLILRYLEVSDCDMEKGTLRCDANISLRPPGDEVLGTKVEIKNLNSFKAVKAALEFEEKRQYDEIVSGGKIKQETRLWNDERSITLSMRSKEEAQDYRYFPEPDLLPFTISEDRVEELRRSLPELPQPRLKRFVSSLGLSEYDAGVLIQDKSLADYFELCLSKLPQAKTLANWLLGPVTAQLNEKGKNLEELKLSADDLISLILLVENKTINNLAAKEVLKEMTSTGAKPEDIVKEKNLAQISDSASLENHVRSAIDSNPKSVADYKNGKTSALMFLVGQVMKATKGKANPNVLQELFKKHLG